MYIYAPASEAQVFVDMVRELQPVLVGVLSFTSQVGKIFRLYMKSDLRSIVDCWMHGCFRPSFTRPAAQTPFTSAVA